MSLIGLWMAGIHSRVNGGGNVVPGDADIRDRADGRSESEEDRRCAVRGVTGLKRSETRAQGSEGTYLRSIVRRMLRPRG